MRMLSSGVVLFVVVAAGALAVAANSYYPLAKEREARERLARNAKAILLPEIQRNEKIVSDMQKILPEGIPMATLDVAAWQTVSSGGLLTGLKPEETTKLLRVYSLIFQVNAVSVRLTELSTGVAAALGDAPQSREFYKHQLQGWLTVLQQAFAEVDKEP